MPLMPELLELMERLERPMRSRVPLSMPSTSSMPPDKVRAEFKLNLPWAGVEDDEREWSRTRELPGTFAFKSIADGNIEINAESLSNWLRVKMFWDRLEILTHGFIVVHVIAYQSSLGLFFLQCHKFASGPLNRDQIPQTINVKQQQSVPHTLAKHDHKQRSKHWTLVSLTCGHNHLKTSKTLARQNFDPVFFIFISS